MWGILGVLVWTVCVSSCLRMVLMRFNFSRIVSLRWGGMQPLIVSDKFPAAAMTLLSGVMSGLVIYLCLWNTAAKISVALVSFIHIIHEW